MKLRLLLTLIITATFFACGDDDETPSLNIPETYEFTRNGQSTVSYQGQTDRLNMVAEMKSYLSNGDQGQPVDASVLLNMYANTNSPFESPELNASTKQLEDKTYITDKDWFKGLFEAAEVASQSTSTATEGTAGLIQRGTDKTILVNEKGWEFTQLVEKGLMGAVFYNQIYNSYLTDAKTGDDVENELLEDGKNYTPMEHHWDEAFGYWGVPVDFPQGDPVLTDAEDRFWAEYTNGRDALLGVNETLMNAYIKGRAAIVAKQYNIKNDQKAIIYDQHELVAAATAVHYINDAMEMLSAGDVGNLFHYLSEAYAFVKALQYSPVKEISQPEIDGILNSDFGTNGNFWEITKEGGLDKLKKAKATIAAVYPEIDAVKDQL